jgi:hypothetical protein
MYKIRHNSFETGGGSKASKLWIILCGGRQAGEGGIICDETNIVLILLLKLTKFIPASPG